MNVDDLIFSLDIGTRTVIGIVGIQEGENFTVLAAEFLEHKSRSMLDGQVHNIEEVAAVALEVKKNLEKKLGVKLTKVAIAAAGRALRTKQIKVERAIDNSKPIDKELISSMEMEGIQMAQFELDAEFEDKDKTVYYCVGYSVINYFLNDYVISSLIGHKGKSIAAEIIGTFLPHTVIDGLYAVMNRIGLEVTSITLEPIAAINVAIPKDLRMLNLVLVDIGAGTSDIAVTRNGSVVAYAMVPVAGDEITEMICHNYLVDFNTAEKIKIQLSSKKEKVSFIDVMGMKQTKNTKEIKELIKPAIVHLSDTICEKIIEYNQKAPNAIFLVGGGCQIVGLTELIAGKLKIPKDRVAVRGREVIRNLNFKGKKLSGPDAITPVGIAITAILQSGHDFLTVVVNGSKVMLFNSRELMVIDALVLAGIKPGELIGRNGKGISISLNGESISIKGGYGKAAEIFVNNEPSNIRTTLSHGDEIVIKTAEDGEKAKLTINELIRKYGDTADSFLVNGEEKPIDYILEDGDVVELKGEVRYEEIKTALDEDNYLDTNENYTELDAIDDDIVLGTKEDTPINKVFYNEKKEEFRPITVYVNNRAILMQEEKEEYIFSDIFKYLDIDLNSFKGKIILILNGNNAGFMDPLKDGDRIEVNFL